MGADEYLAVPAAIDGLTIASDAPASLGEQGIFAARVVSGTHIVYAWDFGDGSNGSGGVIAHTYTAPGVYPVVVTATNGLGSQQAQMTVIIGEVLTIHPGNIITTTDDLLTFGLPAALTGTITITYTPQAVPSNPVAMQFVPLTPLDSFEFAGMAFHLQAVDSNGDEIIQPALPLTLTVSYDESGLPQGADESDLKLMRYDDESGQWVALDVLAHDLSNDTITVTLDHFSEFALLVPKAAYTVFLPLVVR
jgi:PKD repeat protein